MQVTPKPQKACGKSPRWIIDVASALAKKLNFHTGDCILSVVEKLNGKLTYVEPQTISPNKAQIEVNANGKFTIKVSMMTFPLQEKYSIAHEIGHYVLHSQFGKQFFCAADSHYHGEDDMAEFEAHLFASAFLMPISEVKQLPTQSVVDVATHFQVPLNVAEGWIAIMETY